MKPNKNSQIGRIKIALEVSAFVAVSLCSMIPQAEAAVVVRDSTTSVQGPCLDVRNAADAPGTPIQTYTCNATFAQLWNFEGLQIQGIGSNAGTGFNCVWAIGLGVGSVIVLAPCADSVQSWSKKWYYFNHQIVNYDTRLCLDGRGVLGTQATLQTCNGKPYQTWAIRS
jgi:hypothetical protein